MRRSKSLLLGLALLSSMVWPAAAEPAADGLQADRQAATIRLAEQRIICPNRGNRSCRTITVREPQLGCKRVSTGGLGRGNGFKTVCGQGSA